MIVITFIAVLLLGSAYTSPISVSDDDSVLTINEEFFDDQLAIYTAEHEIVRILTPLNALNFDEDEDDESGSTPDMYIFFVEGEFDSEGKFDDKGLYVLKNKTATKLLDHGRDAAASPDETKLVYLASSDGIYVYKYKENIAEPYGTITRGDNIYAIEKKNGTDEIYILTVDHVVYRVFDEGSAKEELVKVKDARQITIDFTGNLFYSDGQNQIYVYTSDGEVVRMKDLPENPSEVKLIRAPFALEEGIPAVVGNKGYTLYINGTTEFNDVVLNAKPSAYSMEAAILQYHARNKKIYEYNILAIIMGILEVSVDQLKNFFSDKTDTVQDLATRSRSTFRA